MSTPDYSGKAVTVSSGDGKWRNACPVDCSWHGSDWEGREAAEAALGKEAEQHQCLKAGREDGQADG